LALNKGNISFIIVGLICLLLPIKVNASDTQYWNEFVFEHDFDEELSLDTALEQQLVNDMSTFALYNITLEPSYKLSNRTSIGLGYRYEREKENGKWATENRYWAHHGIKWQFDQSGLKLKSKIEYRNLENNNYWRFRSKLKYHHEIQTDSSNTTTFLSIEPFYDFNEDKLNQNRTAVGLSFDLSESIEISIYYLNIAKKAIDNWNYTNVLGTEVAIRF